MQGQAKAIIGKTIRNVIARPGADGRDAVVMLQFSDGSCYEFVSPAARKRLRGTGNKAADSESPSSGALPPQLSFFQIEGDAKAAIAA